MNRLLRTPQVFVAVVFLGLFAMAARNVIDPDVWWHLKTGQYIVEHKNVPHTDPFSYTRAGQPWVAHEWLSEVLLYGIEARAGLGALIVIFSAVICGDFFLLYLRCGSGPVCCRPRRAVGCVGHDSSVGSEAAGAIAAAHKFVAVHS